MDKQLLLTLFTRKLRHHLHEPALEVIDFFADTSIKDKNDSHLTKEFLQQKYLAATTDYIGMTPLILTIQLDGKHKKFHIVLKGGKYNQYTHSVFPKILMPLGFSQEELKKSFLYQEFNKPIRSEINYYQLQLTHPILKHYMPVYYGSYQCPHSEEGYLMMSTLTKIHHLNDSEHAAVSWNKHLYKTAIDGVTRLHAEFYGRYFSGQFPGFFQMKNFNASAYLWEKMISFLHQEKPDVYTNTYYTQHLDFIQHISDWYTVLESHPKTLVHADYNYHNIGFIKKSTAWQVVILDWESVRWELPQYDLVQFLLYTSTLDNLLERAEYFIEYMHSRLSQHTGIDISFEDWLLGFQACLQSHIVNRLTLLGVIGMQYHFPNEHPFYQLYTKAMFLLNHLFCKRNI
jgi:hypothetical protein